MKFEATKEGRVMTLTKKEKKCRFCDNKKEELYFNDTVKCLVCMDCQVFCHRGSIATMNYVIDKWEIIKEKKGVKE